MSAVTTDNIREAYTMLQALKEQRPSDFYHPGIQARPAMDNGQLQFHQAPHIFRLLAPGNGFGKTTCVSVEVDWWIQHSHPYQDTPDRQILAAWVCKKYGQFLMMRPEIEKWFTKPFKFNQQHWFYEWENGGKLYILSDDSLWETVQGIQPQLVIADEECDVKIWRELKMRRRAGSDTRFLVSATATKGLRWMYKDLYLPWLDYHQARGMTEEQAMRVQQHEFDEPELAGVPGIFCWPRGGLQDNPMATPAEIAFYRQQRWASEAEKQVRLHGGFRDFNGQPVFNLDNLERLRAGLAAGRSGIIELNPEPEKK